jgi:hypothetical protein
VRGAALLLLVLASACGSEPPPAPAPAAPAPWPEAPPSPGESAAPEAPAAGEARAARAGDRYTVLANEASPMAALAALAEAAGFEVNRAPGAPAEAPRSLALRAAPLERALAEILAGEAYDVTFEPASGTAGGDPTPIRVSVGARPRAESRARAPGAPRAGGPPGDAAGRAPEPRGDGAAHDEAERAERIARSWNDPRDGVRLEAVEEMDPESDEDRARLGQLLRADPSPEVRSAAAEALAEGDPFAVMGPLLAALEDPAPEVVAASVRALENVYDEAPSPRIRERVQALREHRDAEVREAVAEFEEWSLE